MKAFNLLLIAVVTSFSFIACSKEKSTNGSGGIRYKLQAVNQGTNLADNFNGSGTVARLTVAINWTSGFANVTAIKFEAENNSGEVEFRSTIDQKVNIFDPSAVLGIIPVPPGTYKEVEFKAKLAPANGEPAFEIRGDYNGTPIVFRVQNEFEFEGEKENVTITANADYTSIINLQLANLTANISDADLAAAQKTNGEIIISSSSNQALYNRIVNKLGDIDHCDFDDDHDGDHDDDDHD